MNRIFLVTEGDSLTAGQGATLSYPAQLARLYPPQIMMAVSNMATTGNKIADLNTDAAGQITPQFDANKGVNVLVVWVGTNDLNSGLKDPAALYTSVSTYCAARRAEGFKVVICTLTPQTVAGFDVNFETNRQTYNTNVRTNYATWADQLVDIGNNATVGVVGAELNTTYYNADRIHMIDAGYAVVARLVKVAVDTLLAGRTV